jgi:DNA-binding NtrC family response regulator
MELSNRLTDARRRLRHPLTAITRAGARVRQFTMGARILLIDPDPVLRAFLAGLLRGAGHAVWQTGALEFASPQLRTTAVEIVATDPNRAGNGLRSVESLRAAFPGLAVITISAAPQTTGYLRLAATLRASAVLAEPYMSRDLWNLVAACLK